MRRVLRTTALSAVLCLVAACDKDKSDPVITDPNGEDGKLTPIAVRARDNKLEAHARKLSIGRTITRKVVVPQP